ncbi:MAG: DUF1499 domain-containing protein [Alphaproteobacteria bacterium]|nr:DUF1499 domain-containing protein [Alphaproteobacteria bacterium]
MRAHITNAGWRGQLAFIALLLSIATVLWFMVAALGTRFGLWDWQFGLGTMVIGYGGPITMGALAISALALVVAFIKAPRTQPVILALGAVLISSFTLFRLVGFGAHAASLPPIHDIQTDWDNPVMFSAELLAAREADEAMNPVEPAPVAQLPESARERWPGTHGQPVAELQERAEFDPNTMEERDEAPYPYTFDTLITPARPQAVYDTAIALARARGWDIVTADPEAGRIEATETSPWFGFKDDVAIRIEAAEGRTRVDMRSVSRVGLSDLGANAKRVGNFMRELDTQLGRRTGG